MQAIKAREKGVYGVAMLRKVLAIASRYLHKINAISMFASYI